MKNKQAVECKEKSKTKLGFAFIIVILFFSIAIIVFAEETELTRIGSLEKEEISEEDNEALKEYYGSIFDIIGPDTTFNNMAVNENIAIINATIDGRDRRILTKLATGVVLPRITDTLFATKLQANNITVIEHLTILGKTIFNAITSFGKRAFYSVESSEAKYVDEGFARLFNGKANVSINPVLRELISNYNVYLSAEGLTKGIYVAKKTDSYFVVKSLNANSNIAFSWMLSGIKKELDGKLESVYWKGQGIDITATINTENDTSTITINGFDKIIALINHTTNQTQNNQSNQSNDNASNSTLTQLITGNLVDEFGLETELGKILSNTSTLPINETTNNVDNASYSNKTGENYTLGNETIGIFGLEPRSSVFEFTLFSVDEDFIVNQVSIVTGLSFGDVRKLITFVYAKPENFEDEIIEPEIGKIDGIEKVNGSVIIRLG